MSQHDFDITTGDANTIPSMRSAINAGMQALASESSGATPPVTTYAYQPWADTTSGLRKHRNAANTAWVDGLSLANPVTAAGRVLVEAADAAAQCTAVLAGARGREIGDVVWSARDLGAKYLPADGTVYLQASYPDLYGKIGLIYDQLWASTDNAGVVAGPWISELNIFIKVSVSTAYISGDSINWTSASLPNSGAQDVCYSPSLSLFVVVHNSVGAGYISTSPDGATWSAQSCPASFVPTGVIWCEELGLFVAVDGYTTPTTTAIATSPDGITWTKRTTPSITYNWLRRISWSKERGIMCVPAQTDNNFMTSTNGTSWTLRTGPTGGGNYRDIDWSPKLGLFVATMPYGDGAGNYFTSSPDGITWSGAGATPSGHFYIKWLSEKGCFVTGSYHSFDGHTWLSGGAATSAPIYWAPELNVLAVDIYRHTGTTYNKTTQFLVPDLRHPEYEFAGIKPYIKAFA